ENRGYAGLVAERDGEVLGSAFIDERSMVAGIGPVSVDPGAQDAGVGRALMEAALERERSRQAAGVRLVQTAYHYRSLALYLKLGFAVRGCPWWPVRRRRRASPAFLCARPR